MVKKTKKVFHKKFNEKETKAKQDLAYFKKLAKDNLAGWQRAKADYQNLVKRTADEQIDTRMQANEELILDILPILDNFQHATEHLPRDLVGNSWAEGILFIRTQLEKILEGQNVVSIKAIGVKFNPTKHEAVEKVKSEDKSKSDIIVEELQKGYEMNGKVIRAARVKVYI